MVTGIRRCARISLCVLPLYIIIYFVVDVAGVDDVMHVTSRRRSRGNQSKVGKQAADRSLSGLQPAVSRAGVVATSVHVLRRRCRRCHCVTTLWGLALMHGL